MKIWDLRGGWPPDPVHFIINRAVFDVLRRVYGGQARREPAD